MDVPPDYQNPDWKRRFTMGRYNTEDKVHNWRNHVPESVVSIWGTFTDEQKRVLAETYNAVAINEEWD
jgi:hypothetical protein